MTEQEYTQRLFGTADDGVLYLPGPLMRSAKVKPGDKLRIVVEKQGFRIQVEGSDAGQPGKVQARNHRSDVSLDDKKGESSL